MNRSSKHVEHYSFDFALAVSSTAFLNAPKSAVNCIFSLAPADSRYLDDGKQCAVQQDS
jgi:hypothetical protein